MNKFTNAVRVENDLVVIDQPLVLDSREDEEQLQQAIRSAFIRRGHLRQHARFVKGITPSTYGLDKEHMVTVGKGGLYWELESIEATYDKPYPFVAKLRRNDGPFGYKYTSADVTRLVQTTTLVPSVITAL